MSVHENTTLRVICQQYIDILHIRVILCLERKALQPVEFKANGSKKMFDTAQFKNPYLESPVKMLPAVDLRRLVGLDPSKRKASRHLANFLPEIDSDILFCGFKVTTRAAKYTTEASHSHDVPVRAKYAKVAAIEKAASLLSQLGEPYGWHFIVNSLWFPEGHIFSRSNPMVNRAEHLLRDQATSLEASAEHFRDIEMSEGARHRWEIYRYEARNPESYLLGIRVRYI